MNTFHTFAANLISIDYVLKSIIICMQLYFINLIELNKLRFCVDRKGMKMVEDSLKITKPHAFGELQSHVLRTLNSNTIIKISR